MIVVQQLKRWFVEPVEHAVLQVPRALIASVAAACLDCGILALLVEAAGWHPKSAAIVGYLAGGVIQYVLCSVWVFSNAPASKTIGFLTFVLLSLGGLAITWGVMAVGEWCHLTYSAKLAALALSFGWNFASRKFLLFNNIQRSSALSDPDIGDKDAPFFAEKIEFARMSAHSEL